MELDEKKGTSLVAKICRKEMLILLVGLFTLWSGFHTGNPMQYFWGGTIIVGAVALHFVRKKDWKRHWEEQERFREALEERRRRQREGGE